MLEKNETFEQYLARINKNAVKTESIFEEFVDKCNQFGVASKNPVALSSETLNLVGIDIEKSTESFFDKFSQKIWCDNLNFVKEDQVTGEKSTVQELNCILFGYTNSYKLLKAHADLFDRDATLSEYKAINFMLLSDEEKKTAASSFGNYQNNSYTQRKGTFSRGTFSGKYEAFFDRPELREFVKKKILLFGVDLDKNKTFILYASGSSNGKFSALLETLNKQSAPIWFYPMNLHITSEHYTTKDGTKSKMAIRPVNFTPDTTKSLVKPSSSDEHENRESKFQVQIVKRSFVDPLEDAIRNLRSYSSKFIEKLDTETGEELLDAPSEENVKTNVSFANVTDDELPL